MAGGKPLDHQNDTATTGNEGGSGSAKDPQRVITDPQALEIMLSSVFEKFQSLKKKGPRRRGKLLKRDSGDLCGDPARDQRAEILLLFTSTKSSQSGPIPIQA